MLIWFKEKNDGELEVVSFPEEKGLCWGNLVLYIPGTNCSFVRFREIVEILEKFLEIPGERKTIAVFDTSKRAVSFFGKKGIVLEKLF